MISPRVDLGLSNKSRVHARLVLKYYAWHTLNALHSNVYFDEFEAETVPY